MEKFLIVGLGNPGQKYQNTRHNIGFRVLDNLSKRLNISFVTKKEGGSSFSVGDTIYRDLKIFLLKPLDFMNISGNAVSKMVSFFKIPLERVLVVHDDLDVPFGRLKIVRSGGHGGHNGIRSIIDRLGSKNFPRIKVGIGRPPENMPADKYVLSHFTNDEIQNIEKICNIASDAVIVFIENGIEKAMNQFNGKNFFKEKT